MSYKKELKEKENLKKEDNKKRVFISIDIPETIKEKINEIQLMLPDFKGKLTEKENLHLTLKFLGEQNLETIEKIKEKLKETEFNRFDCKIDDIGVFSEKYIRIIWLKIKGAEDLQKIIDEKISEVGINKEKRFMSHLTIARVKNLKNKKEFLEKIRKIKIPELGFSVEEFKLKESVLKPEGPYYKTIRGFYLK
ncbi:MAG: RNA 2',3'-cyclic phosphodiesterase [Minisyncoccales bacterium]